ncbi:hypothetical protein [Lysinibacillus sp. F5]|uniref:hypothetical protein n=1 Tax=Lysinibacillus sp. F5 TaxID=1700846 RepID=UPI0007388C01|nr:hypothetical protein [Lysinibacillus sp. F5]KUF37446.1 hypothetical protein AK833_00725 [Lysinibacillus sp. F5]
MYNRGNRIFYDSATGMKLWETGEVWGSSEPMEHQEIEGEIMYVDLEVKSYDSMKCFISSINRETKEPIFEFYPVAESTEEQLRIKELEDDILLLKTDSEVGGIL